MRLNQWILASAGTILILALAGGLLVSPVEAQDPTDPVAQSVREPSDLLLDDMVATAAGFEPGQISAQFLLIPNFAAAEGVQITGATLGLKFGGFPSGMSIQVRAIGKILDLADDNRGQIGADLKVSYGGNDRFSAALKGSLVRTNDVRERAQGELAFDFKAIRGSFHTLTPGLTIRYRADSPEVGNGVDGAIAVLGLTWGLGSSTALVGGYEFESDVTTEDSFSVTLLQRLPQLPVPTMLLVTGAKHRVIAINLAMTF